MRMVSTTKRMMDVEDVIRWACGAIAGRGPPGVQQTRAMNAPRSEASLVGRWTWPTGFPEISPMFAGGFSTGRTPVSNTPDDPDALKVEAAIGMLPQRMTAYTAPDELALDIGSDVDLVGAFAAPLANVANIVLTHGRLGNRPAIGFEIPIPTPKLAPNGKPGVWQLQCSIERTIGGDHVERLFEAPVQGARRGVYPSGSFCILEYEPSPQSIINDRAEYLAWRLALGELAELLSGRLERIAALPPAAALAPWLGDRDGDKPRDLFGLGAERIYTATQALAVRARREARSRRTIAPSGGKLRRPTRPGRLKSIGGG
jgi:hypothetical protein